MDHADLEYLRGVMERSDRRFEQMVARWDKREERRHREAMASLHELQAKTSRILAEGEDSRRALLAVLDRLDGGGGAAPAT